MKKYNCPNCGAELFWDADANALKCDYCDHEYQPEELDKLMARSAEIRGEKQGAANEKKAEEKQVREANEQDRATDESEKIDLSDLVVYACKNCGAEVITSRSTVATTCAFCGRAISLTDKMVGDFRPDSVIPFLIDEKKARDIYKTYTAKGLLSPKKFSSAHELKKMKGVYVPFWLHSYTEKAVVDVDGENMTSHKRGYDKVIEHHMYRVNMDVEGDFESIPTDGLKNLNNDLMAAIEPFDYSKLTDFNPAYMAGFYAEEYDEAANETVHEAHIRSRSAMESNSISNAGFYQTKLITAYSPSYENEISKYAMMPVWLFNVEYNKKNYQFAVNGETGKVAGKLPISKLKLAASIAGSFLGTQLIALIVRLFTM
ncbi:MAG: FYDLN acid domain-containing protein [Clostridia bacterium]|nr:FYDLN acid domain-containing protein [Clostridia bacterium]